MNSSSAGIAQFFRSCQAIRIGSDTERRQDIFPKTYFTAQHVVNISRDPKTVNSLGLEELLSRLDLSKNVEETRRPEYKELYPENWVADAKIREQHQETVNKIVRWPRDENNQFDPLMVALMTLILAFHADFYTLVNRERVEKVQLKYIIILQRYLKSKLKPETSNTKFLDAMLLIDQTREAWQISRNQMKAC